MGHEANDPHAGHEHYNCPNCGKVFHSKQEQIDHTRRIHPARR